MNVQDMMTEIMTNKPNDPVEYLVQHLQNVIEKRKDCDRDDSGEGITVTSVKNTA